jgi:pyrimidine-nucleoside phosphorylase
MQKYNPVELLLKKRDGIALSFEEISGFVNGYLSGEIAEYQMSAMLGEE